MSKAPEKQLYELRRKYWDGRRDYAIGERLMFVPGNQPSTAVAVRPDDEPELDLVLPAKK